MMRAFALLTTACLVAAGCAQSPRPAPTAAAPAASEMAGATGPARDCVGLRQIRDTNVRSDQIIDFVMVDGTVLRNTLPNSCPSLGFERAFTYKTSLSQLCSVDIITVIQQGGGVRPGASCGLGKFVPISAEMAKAEVPRR